MGFAGLSPTESLNLLKDIAEIGGLLVACTGLIFAGYEIRKNTRARRIANRIAILEHHRELWSLETSRPELSSVRSAKRDLANHPMTEIEAGFISLRILLLSTCVNASEEGELIRPDGLKRDVQTFFARPLVKEAWEKAKKFQNKALIVFVEDCLAEK